MTVLAGDIGGTNSRLAIYDVPASGAARREADLRADLPLGGATRRWTSSPKSSWSPPRPRSARAPRSRRACLGIAGPDREQHLPRHQPALGRRRARAVAAARDRARHAGERLHRRRAGRHRRRRRRAGRAGRRTCRVAHGPMAVLGAGTGLGQAFLLWSAADNRYQVVPSEGGHVDLAARTPLEHGLVHFLTEQVRARLVRARAVRARAWSTCSRSSRKSRPAAGSDPPRDRRRAGARPRQRSRRRDLPARAGRHRSRSARWRSRSSVPCWARWPATWG